ncbi:hypothetical protein [Phenylobacterium sp.]|uniref:hypothetical protein n=1 Tax=Phenylobacterium sp. TaxID=1871053 RepID=UPI002CAF2D76|nr:hypothetical protein [Phenylobacterium sp.]HVI33691.1 hypothetical protein [Phenylobacterium sp.]
MPITVRLAAALAALALAVPAAAAEGPPDETLTLRNEASELVYCAVLLNGRLFVNVRLKPGAHWSRPLDPRRKVELVCNRLKKSVYGPLQPGGSYSFVDGGERVDLKAAEGE